ncbi:hypothetical protein [Xenorhabdus sp. IM139775]|uniref:hypothetical protein n=1 Tax=Xenorhabdus sp. IM139775 TaxID=3025876 RepID=UPI002359C1D9|nr:hypothetical protein [Xenorhabdus sp. IM139775]MDC9595171.1 hypothetical protein [Xenorhabdus sp. IM139775]
MLQTAGKISLDGLLDEYSLSHMLRPEEVTRRDVLHWRHYILGEKKQSVHSWNNKVAHLRAIFNFGIERNLLPHNEKSV